MKPLISNDIFAGSLFDNIPAMPVRPRSASSQQEEADVLTLTAPEEEEERYNGPIEPINLYPWQAEAVEALRENIRSNGGKVSQILAAPTGSGKTTCAAYLIDACYKKGQRALFIADRTNLVDQTSRTFDRHGIPHGIIMADHWRAQPWQRIQIASAQTLARRRWPEADIYVVDECHALYANVTKRLMQKDTNILGLSATPFTKGLGRIYDKVVNVRTLNQLTEEGYLAPFEAFAASEPDMTGAKTVAGEWTDAEAEKRALPIIGDIVKEYLRHGQDKKFICFAVSVSHAEQLQRQFMESGVVTGLYSYRTGDEERKEMLKEFDKPDSFIRGLISISALGKGFDNPGVEVVILARPLRNSFAEHIQLLGRGLRRDQNNPSKKCIVLDHSGNLLRFWQRMQDFFQHGVTELDDGKKKEPTTPKEKKEPEPTKCPKCSRLHRPAPACPNCGHEYPKRNAIHHVAGELSPLSKQPVGSLRDQQAIYGGLLSIAAQQKRSKNWADSMFKARFGLFPTALHKVEIAPTPELRKWVTAQDIKKAKAAEFWRKKNRRSA